MNIITLSLIAIVGNSLGANFSYYNNIDNNTGVKWVSNHSIGGDTLLSYGLTADVENYEKGYGKGIIANFPNESQNYDTAILFFGSNEIEWNVDVFIKQYKKYIKKLKCKVIVMGIPHSIKYKRYEIDIYNRAIKKMCEELKIRYVPITTKKSDYIDGIHLTREKNIELYKSIIKEMEDERI